ncbi:uncharacterized protein LOC144180043 [Haemaphysalis longicornis]
MPALPRDTIKIVLRPRGGINLAKLGIVELTAAVHAAAGTTKEVEYEDILCVNAQQNIVVICTSDEERATRYSQIKEIAIREKKHEVWAYRTAPHDTVKGVIRGIPISETSDNIDERVVNKRNPLALGAKRIGETTTVIVVFKGAKVPNYVRQRFRALLHKASAQAGCSKLLVCGDFNAMDQSWGYVKSNAKGRNLAQDALDNGYVLVTDPANPTRTGNSVSRDTTPDLTFVKNIVAEDVQWKNTGLDLGSDHMIVETTVRLSGASAPQARKHKWVDWEAFRRQRNEAADENEHIQDIAAWMKNVTRDVRLATREIEMDVQVDSMDSRLVHLIQAKRSLQERWKKQRLNRGLRKKIAGLNRKIEEHCHALNNQKWNELCNAADGQLHNGRTWNLFRHLLDKTKTKSYQRDRLAKILHAEIKERGEDAVKKKLLEKYIPSTPKVTHRDYFGSPNDRLDRDIDVEEVRTALQELNSRSAPGPDHVPNGALKNLDDRSIVALTKYFNECWSMIGFRQHLCTQDAMIQLKHLIVDRDTRDSRAVMGLDLQGAFDNVNHSAILSQVSKLNMGKRTHEYIGSFLTGRTAEIVAGDLATDAKENGSRGTPQGSRDETNKLNVVIRRAYKTAIGVPECTSTERLYTLGIHNTLDEIAEAQRIAQLERLSMTKPGSGVDRIVSASLA